MGDMKSETVGKRLDPDVAANDEAGVPVGLNGDERDGSAKTIAEWLANARSDGGAFPSLSKVSKATAIYEIVKEGISAGLWLPGDRINDKVLSEQLGVSRISVREALSKLVESQVVERVQWRGFFLRKPSLKDVKSIIEIRIALEELAIRRVMKKNDSRLYEALEKSIDDAEKVISSGDHSRYMATDFGFHDLIHEASGNPWIKTIIGNLRMTINILRNVSMMVEFESAAYASTADHREILAHMRAGNVRGAFKSLRNHMKIHYRNIAQEYGDFPSSGEKPR